MGAKRPLSEETKRKISAAKTGKSNGPHSEETRQKIAEALAGKQKSVEHRENLWKNRHRPGPTYGSTHRDLRAKLGSARNRECVDCRGPAHDWSLRIGSLGLIYDEKWPGWFSVNPEDYEPRCRPCHVAYDRKDVSNEPAVQSP